MWYDLLFALAVILWLAVPFAAWWEERQHERDREFYARRFGSTR